jgi:AcrR family transcriptional regulator
VLTDKGRRTRARILETAARLMYEHGVAATSIDQICTAADVGKSQLYHYFTDKSDLVRGVIHFLARSALLVQAPLLSRVQDWDGWRAWRNEVIELQRRAEYRGGSPLGAMASELAGRDEQARLALTSSFDRWETHLQAALSRTVEFGALRGDVDVPELATYLLAALQGGLVLCQARHDVAPLEVSLDGAIARLESYAR